MTCEKFESFGKVALVEEPGGLGDKSQRLVGVGKLAKSKLDSEATKIFPHCAAVTMAKGPGQMGRLHSGQLCDAGETVLFGKVSV